jgi:Ca2+-binding RTX toxin-like protein
MVISSVSFSLAASAGVRFVENLTLTGNGTINGTGNALNNRISGNSGDNRLDGGVGDDALVGGAGRDRLTGGDGADVFVFSRITETGKTSTTRDVITDFQIGIDDIDLQAIDANTARTGNQAFTFIGGDAFSSTAGELRFAGGVISGDVNGDGKADFQIAVTGITSMAEGDFIL